MFLRNVHALRELGLPSMSLYGLYSLALRSGYFRWRLPIQTWEQVDLSRHLNPNVPSNPNGYVGYRGRRQRYSLFQLFDSSHPVIQAESDQIEREANAMLQGRFRLFGIQGLMLGYPPDWHSFAPLAEVSEKTRVNPEHHWSQYRLEQLPQDVKLLWEPSRFGWVYPLSQAYRLSGDARYYEAFWTLYSSWLEANQPQAGLHWYSAQEVAIRLIALLFAAHTFDETLREEPQRWTELLKGIAIHAERIPASLSYARAQNNNHLLVECAALYLVGINFPELQKAQAWKRLGRQCFEGGLARQVFVDGGYIQHSANYQRLALQAGLLVAKAAQDEGIPLSQSSLLSLGTMAQCLSALADEESGSPPNFGPNDGAMLLPLTACGFNDFRPTVQAAWRLLWGQPRYPSGKWDDLALWLGLEGEADGILEGRAGDSMSEQFPQAGLHIIRKENTKTILRAVHFRSRPGHSDQMHLDIWRQGINLARDPGTYLYNADPPWDNRFSGAWCHNTLSIDGREPMLKAGRFLWLEWSQASVLGRWKSSDDQIDVIFAQHRARRRQRSQHQRTLAVVGGDLIVVADDVLGGGEHRLVLNWNLADLTWHEKESGITLKHDRFSVSLLWMFDSSTWGLYRAGEQIAGEDVVEDPTPYGWHASTYAQRKPGLQLVLEARQRLPARIVTLWTFNETDPDALHVNWLPIESGRPAFDHLGWNSLEWGM